MTRKVFTLFLTAVLLLGVFVPTVSAAEETQILPPEADVTVSEEPTWDGLEDIQPPEADIEEISPISPEDTVGETEETREGTEMEAEEVTEDPIEADRSYIDLSQFDPEDPLYAYYADKLSTMDGIATVSTGSASSAFAKYTTRDLASNETLRWGIDVSAWQGDINWSSVAASGIEFVIIRAAYRGVDKGVLSTDGRFASYVQGAKAAGLKVGVYIYSQAITVAEGEEEARYLLDLVSGYDIDLPLVIDYEYYGYSGRLYNAKLSRQAKTDICNAFCRVVEDAGYDSMVYANLSMLSSDMYAEQLGRVWLAHYTTKTSYTGSYEYWQPGQGYISGISGEVDIDFWFDPGASIAEDVPSDPVIENPFLDVNDSDWFAATVLEAYAAGIIMGTSDTTFSPRANASRGQVVTMIYRMEGEPYVSALPIFEDLSSTYYVDAISWASDAGIVAGYSPVQFGPDDPIIRQDLATILYRLAGSPAVSGDLSAFSDASAVSSYAVSAMSWAVENGILAGYEDSTLRPTQKASRAEVCAMLMRYMALGA